MIGKPKWRTTRDKSIHRVAIERPLMRYRDFIDELRSLVVTSQRLSRTGMTHEDAPFREWRHRIESLVREASVTYRLPGNCQSAVRVYGSQYADLTRSACAFEADLNDTTIELKFLIDHFNKYGQADRSGVPSVASSELASPEKVTPAWLVKNVSVGIWMYAIGILVAAFSLGVTVAKLGIYDVVKRWFTPST